MCSSDLDTEVGGLSRLMQSLEKADDPLPAMESFFPRLSRAC